MTENMKHPLRVFLCHAKADKHAVRTLYKQLVADGVDAWLDEEKLIPGQIWQEEIPNAVRNSDVVIVCLSKQSINKEGYVQKEIKVALDIADEKPEGTIFIIPIRLEECDAPDRLKKYQWVDIFVNHGYQRLMVALSKRANQIELITPKPKKLVSRAREIILSIGIFILFLAIIVIPFWLPTVITIGVPGSIANPVTPAPTLISTFTPTSLKIPTPLSPQEQRDNLFGIIRLEFKPAFNTSLGIQISRLEANEAELYLLDSVKGSVIRSVVISGSDYQVDITFYCEAGIYGEKQVGPLVDILIMPKVNAHNASILGIDAVGNLLYCAPGQAPQAMSLPKPITNWGKITSIIMDNGNLYVMDQLSRAIWIYPGKEGSFSDMPYFFFDNQIPELNDAVDFAVNGDDLIILHEDGSFSYCSYSHADSMSTQCSNLLTIKNPFVVYDDPDLFVKAHIAQMFFTSLPDQSLFLLDAASNGVLRITPRTMELQTQYRGLTGKENPFSLGSISAMTVGPSRILYLAVDGQVYFSSGIP